MDIPAWLGFGFIILVGIAAIILGAAGAMATTAGAIAFGVATIVSGILAWATGATTEWLTGSFGVSVRNIKGWAWWVIFGLYVVVGLIFAFVR